MSPDAHTAPPTVLQPGLSRLDLSGLIIGSASTPGSGAHTRGVTMSLAERLAERSTPTETACCSLGRLLETLDGDELEALKTMLGTPDNWGLSAPEIYEDLKAEGHTVGFKVINKHRGGHK